MKKKQNVNKVGEKKWDAPVVFHVVQLVSWKNPRRRISKKLITLLSSSAVNIKTD